MSTIGEALIEIINADVPLSTAIGGNIFFEFAPQNTPNPCLVYNLIDTAEDTKDSSQITHTVIQIDTYADSGGQAATVNALVKTALDRKSGIFAGVNIDTIIYQDYFTAPDPSESIRYTSNFRARINV